MPPVAVTVQVFLDLLSRQAELLSGRLCHPIVTFVQEYMGSAPTSLALQLQGAAIGLLLLGGWLWAGIMRNRELRRQRRSRHYRLSNVHSGTAQRLGVSAQDAPGQADLPGVTVVLPVRGCRPHSRRTWRSQLSMLYGGSVEFLFIVDSKGDPAYAALQSIMFDEPRQHAARIVVAPLATTQSQKICNLMTGIQAAKSEHKYVLCLDDDVVMHPLSLHMLVQALEADPSAFMATGYPLDVPPSGSSLLAYCALAYHLPLLIAFSLWQATSFVWGGCMLFPLAALRSDCHGIMRAWREGGYSDDLTVASVCKQQQLKILCPSFAIFPQWLDGTMQWRRYWNYLRRQLFVLDTYTSPGNRSTNHTMMCLHAYLSLAFVLPTVAVALRLGLWALQMALLPTQKVWDGPGTSLHWLTMFGTGACPLNVLSVALLLASFVAAGLSLAWMVSVACALFQELSPSTKPVYAVDMFNWAKVWAAFFLSNAILPGCMVYTALTSTIEWSGMHYRKTQGRIVRVNAPIAFSEA